MRLNRLALAGLMVGALCVPAWAQLSGGGAAEVVVSTPPASSLDLTSLIATYIIPDLAYLVVSLASIAAIWAARWFKKKTGIDIEAQLRNIEANHRDALHSAVMNALGLALARYGKNLVITGDSTAGQMIVDFVKKSVPEAVQALGVGDQWIVDTAASKLQVEAPPVPTVVISPPAVSTGGGGSAG